MSTFGLDDLCLPAISTVSKNKEETLYVICTITVSFDTKSYILLAVPLNIYKFDNTIPPPLPLPLFKDEITVFTHACYKYVNMKAIFSVTKD